MDAIKINTTKDKVVVTINKKSFDEEHLDRILNFIKFEALVQKADFDESIVELGEEITKNWWLKNKDKFIQKNKGEGHNC